MIVIGYMELPEDELPPEEMWHHTSRLAEWFDAVKERRKNPDQQPIDSFDVPVMANQDKETQELLERVRG
jgi:hypothetical protein